MDELIRGLQAGRADAFERLVREFGDRVFRFLKRMAGSRRAEDLTQEVFVRVFRSIATYQAGRFESWLFTIANHLAIDESRRRRELPLSELGEEARAERRPARTAEPLELLEARERQEALMAAVARLPEDQRRVFLLRQEAELSFGEIAELTGCPLNTALSRMHYAMEALRKAMKSHAVS
jgi:RNA polymerase sigma-70 factor (ECF subfamily)